MGPNDRLGEPRTTDPPRGRAAAHRHVFQQQEQFTQCRIDHYQTPTEVHASVFAKQADPATSVVKIEETEVRARSVCPPLHLPPFESITV